MTRIEYPVIPEQYLNFSDLFEEIGVEKFALNNLIDLIQEKIPTKVLLEDSIFETVNELYGLFSFIKSNIESNFDQRYINEIKTLNIFLTNSGHLENNKDSSIKEMPAKLDLIKDDLPVKQIDSDLISKFKDCLGKLGVSKFENIDLVQILINDFANIEYPIRISEAKPYISDKQKLLLNISFIQDMLKQYNADKDDYDEANKNGVWFQNGKLTALQDEKFKIFESKIKSIAKLPIILSEDDCLYPLQNNAVYDLDIEYQQEFANLIGLKKLDPDIKKALHKLTLVPSLHLNIIIDHIELYLEDQNHALKDSDLLLIYQLIAEGKAELNEGNINKLRNIPVFKNNKHELCSLNNNGKKMMLRGKYPVPEGFDISDILDESLLNNVREHPDFKTEILKSVFKVKSLTFELFVRQYFSDIFSDNKISTSDKLRLIDTLNAEFIKLQSKESFSEIKRILLGLDLILCNDGNFHCPSKEKNVFFKSREFDDLFGLNYLYPDYRNIQKYSNFFKEIGINETLNEDRFIQEVKSRSSETVNKTTVEQMKKLFLYLNNNWEKFNDKSKFEELSKIEWLPVVGCVSKLYYPSALYLQNSDETQNTKPFLSQFNDIQYLDINDSRLRKTSTSTRLKREMVDIIGLNNVQKIPTQRIIDNLKLLSKRKKLIKNPLNIYSELNKRARNDPISVKMLIKFNSIHIKYEDEKNPRYYSTTEVFKKNLEKLYGYEYIGYLPLEYTEKCKSLYESLNILDEPDLYTIKKILEKMEHKYAETNYLISDQNDDKKILLNCLNYLSDKTESSDFMEMFTSELKKIHILCNNEGRLVTPEYAILDDNSVISDQFENKLGDRFIKYNLNHLSLFKKLEIKKISQIVNKELVNKPDEPLLKINPQFTKKLRYFSYLIPRIKVGNEESTKHNDRWRDFHPDLKVYDFEALEVMKYISISGNKYEAKENKDFSYIVKDEATLNTVYVKGSDEEILNSLSHELFETIHPHLDRNFISTIYSLLKMNSLEEMNRYLTDYLGYPVVENQQDTSLSVNKKIDRFSEEEGIESEESENPPEFTEIDEDPDSQDSFPINESEMKTSQNNYLKPTTEEMSDIGHTITTSLSKPTNSCEKKKIRPCSGSSYDSGSPEEHHTKKSSSDLEKGTGRTKNPTEYTDFKEEIEKHYSNKSPESTTSGDAIDEDLEPMSLEYENVFNQRICEEIEKEIRAIRHDTNRREYTKHLDRIREEPIAKFEVKDFYKGKCQICHYTFRKKNGENHCIITSLLEKRYGGIRHPANYLCLCPNHAALLKHSKIIGLDRESLDNLKDNKIIFTAGTSKYEIKYHPIHFKMLKELLKRGN